MLRAVLLTALVFVAADALKCHVVTAGNLSVADTSQPSECAIGSLSCMKMVDFTRGTYTKQCQMGNCTMNQVPNSVANCQNTSSFGVNLATCCCYGDGCNAAPQTSALSVIGFAVAIASALQFF